MTRAVRPSRLLAARVVAVVAVGVSVLACTDAPTAGDAASGGHDAGHGASFSGTANCAAAVGVAARRSATKSTMEKSVSCPMPEMTGIVEARMARARLSSL